MGWRRASTLARLSDSAAKPFLHALARVADLLDGRFHCCRRLSGLLRLVADLVVLPSGDPCAILLAASAGLFLRFCHLVPPFQSQRVATCQGSRAEERHGASADASRRPASIARSPELASPSPPKLSIYPAKATTDRAEGWRQSPRRRPSYEVLPTMQQLPLGL